VLQLLLDEHLHPAVAEGLRRRRPACIVFALKDWENGAHLGASDEDILKRAAEQGLTLVTYDIRTIPPLLAMSAPSAHAGVILINSRTIGQRDIGMQIRSLTRLWDDEHQAEWTDRVLFLGSVPPRG
jgi:Domain of unknown function (DUF5615)